MPKIPYSKRPDGRYYKQIITGVDENGKRKVKTLYDRNWHELDKKVRAFQNDLEQGHCIEKDITLGECIDLWWYTQVHLSPGTRKTYRSNLKKISHLRDIKLKDLKPIHLQAVYSDLYKANTRNLIRQLPAIIKRILEFAVVNHFVAYNVAERIKVPKLRTEARRALTDEEKSAVQQAFKVFTPFQKTFVAFLLYTGMRRSEVLAIRISDIHFDEGFISVERTVAIDDHYIAYEKQGTKTRAGVRKVPLMPELKDIITEYIQGGHCCDNGYFFLTRKNHFMDSATFRYHWTKILSMINQFMPDDNPTNISPHYFRHNFATEMVYAKIPLKTIQYIMGHEHIQLTMDVYTDVKFNAQDSIKALEAYWQDNN